jgi:HSP20 family protein
MKKKYKFYWEEKKKEIPENEIKIELPGYNKDEISVTIDNNMANISASKKQHSVRKGKNFYAEQETAQSISRSFTLPELNKKELDIEIKDGVVTIKKKKKIREN